MEINVVGNAPTEIWQVDVGGQFYEANFEELAQWITEGSLLPQDKVRRGNLRWIEAQKVPLLHGFFNARELGIAPPPVVVTTTTIQPTPQAEFNPTKPSVESQVAPFSNDQQAFSDHRPVATETKLTADAPTGFCLVHIETPPKYSCEGCANVFCGECPQAYGGTVRICPMCGAMCKSITELIEKEQKAVALRTAGEEGFGLVDFGRALVYPLKFRVSFFFGAVFYLVVSVGEHASSLGGRWLISGSIMCWMLANMLTFGILAQTVENMLQGKTGQNFMPGFDDFTLWDDVIHPLFLSVSTYLVSFGAFATLCLIMAYLVVSSATSDLDALKNKNVVPFVAPELQADYGSAKTGKEQIDLVKETMRQNSDYMQQQRELAEGEANGERGRSLDGQAGNASPPVLDEEKQFQQMNEMIERTRAQQLESTIGEQTDGRPAGLNNLYGLVAGWGGPFIILALITLIWGIFYFPAALIVAAYTRNLGSVMNPLIGLDSVRRLGGDYFKILFFGFVLTVIGTIINSILNIVFMPFDLPRLGNLAAVAVGSVFTFYLSIVFAVLIGFALYKNLNSFKLYGN
jgi:hypothetical protein